ncbi:MAG: PIN domain-containing protein [Fimbriimonadaceae bacterium]|nr:PIN domain-containing protein [Fimbriimonadaceae bacterium]
MFVDSWAWIAWVQRQDRAHPRVAALSKEIREGGGRLLTSKMVLCEALTRLRYDSGLPAALALVSMAELMSEAGALEVLGVDDAVWAAAVDILRRYADQRFSFTDCTSFALMQARGVSEALTADTHFAIAGFVPLGAA